MFVFCCFVEVIFFKWVRDWERERLRDILREREREIERERERERALEYKAATLKISHKLFDSLDI